MEAHRAGHALELDRANLLENDPRVRRGIDDLLADEHLAGPAYSAIRAARLTVRPK